MSRMFPHGRRWPVAGYAIKVADQSQSIHPNIQSIRPQIFSIQPTEYSAKGLNRPNSKYSLQSYNPPYGMVLSSFHLCLSLTPIKK